MTNVNSKLVRQYGRQVEAITKEAKQFVEELNSKNLMFILENSEMIRSLNGEIYSAPIFTLHVLSMARALRNSKSETSINTDFDSIMDISVYTDISDDAEALLTKAKEIVHQSYNLTLTPDEINELLSCLEQGFLDGLCLLNTDLNALDDINKRHFKAAIPLKEVLIFALVKLYEAIETVTELELADNAIQALEQLKQREMSADVAALFKTIEEIISSED